MTRIVSKAPFYVLVASMMLLLYSQLRLISKEADMKYKNKCDTPDNNKNVKEQWHVLVTVSLGFQDMFENWLIYFCNLNLTMRLIIVAEDEETYNRYSKIPKLFVIRSSEPMAVKDSLTYETKEYNKLVSKRPAHILNVLRPGMNVIYTDIDTVWLQDPTPYFIGPFNMWLNMDSESVICTGFIAMKYHISVVRFLSRWKHSLTQPKLNQPAFNKIFRKSNIAYSKLSRKRFPSGNLYFGKNRQEWRENVVVVHNNYIKGHDKKLNRFVEEGLWVYNSTLSIAYVVESRCKCLNHQYMQI